MYVTEKAWLSCIINSGTAHQCFSCWLLSNGSGTSQTRLTYLGWLHIHVVLNSNLVFQHLRVRCVAVINDTVGALLACAHMDSDCQIGLILGMGILYSYLLNSHYTINMEFKIYIRLLLNFALLQIFKI